MKSGSEKYSAKCRFMNRTRQKYFGARFFRPGAGKSTLEPRESAVGDLKSTEGASPAAVRDLESARNPSTSAGVHLETDGTSAASAEEDPVSARISRPARDGSLLGRSKAIRGGRERARRRSQRLRRTEALGRKIPAFQDPKRLLPERYGPFSMAGLYWKVAVV